MGGKSDDGQTKARETTASSNTSKAIAKKAPSSPYHAGIIERSMFANQSKVSPSNDTPSRQYNDIAKAVEGVGRHKL